MNLGQYNPIKGKRRSAVYARNALFLFADKNLLNSYPHKWQLRLRQRLDVAKFFYIQLDKLTYLL